MLEISAVLKKNLKLIAYRFISGKAVIVNLENRTIAILNLVASRIWELIDGKRTVNDIIEKIFQEFDVSFKKAEKDCVSFLLDMKRNNLVLSSFSDEVILNERADRGQKESKENIFGILREETAKNKIPIVGHFDLTYKCNLSCKHCYLSPENRKELNLSKVKTILFQLAEAGVLYLTLSGGEIFTRKDIFEIISYAKKLHFALRLLTNGTLLDEGKIDKMASFCPEMVAISIYSMNPQIHDRITGMPGSFLRAVLAIKMLKKKGINLKISTVIMKQNVNDYGSIAILAKKFKVQFQADYRISPKTNGDKSPLKFHIGDKKLREVFLDPILQRRHDDIDSDFMSEEDYQGVFNTIPCGAGHMSFYISPYGDVYPCVQLPVNCGNLKEKLFSDIWNKSEQLLNIRSITINDLPVCSSCDLFQYCRLCIGYNHVEEGDIFSPSKRACKEARLRKELGQKRR